MYKKDYGILIKYVLQNFFFIFMQQVLIEILFILFFLFRRKEYPLKKPSLSLCYYLKLSSAVI